MRGLLPIGMRLTTAIVSAVAWLALANHCALGLARIEDHKTEPAAHDCCGTELPAHPTPTEKPSAPCCKTLRAVAVALIQAPAWVSGATELIPADNFALAELPRPILAAQYFPDTGPPGGASFLETLLQRSLPAHAPPALS
jgi:hypothetical protein